MLRRQCCRSRASESCSSQRPLTSCTCMKQAQSYGVETSTETACSTQTACPPSVDMDFQASTTVSGAPSLITQDHHVRGDIVLCVLLLLCYSTTSPRPLHITWQWASSPIAMSTDMAGVACALIKSLPTCPSSFVHQPQSTQMAPLDALH